MISNDVSFLDTANEQKLDWKGLSAHKCYHLSWEPILPALSD